MFRGGADREEVWPTRFGLSLLNGYRITGINPVMTVEEDMRALPLRHCPASSGAGGGMDSGFRRNDDAWTVDPPVKPEGDSGRGAGRQQISASP